MSRTNKILLAILLILLCIQFVRPEQNRSNITATETDMLMHFRVPSGIGVVFKASCYDCHSNNTRYPWYTNVQPIGWLLAKHGKDGKEELNFIAFAEYSSRRQLSKLKSIENSIKDGSMPLRSYTLLHPDARLSEQEKLLLQQWTSKTIDSLENHR